VQRLSGGVTSPQGFRAAGVAAGIKPAATKDLALIVSDVPAVAAATFTTNAVKAAPVVWDMDLINRGASIQAVVVNSGNANACTGYEGVQHVRETVAAVAAELSIPEETVFVASTGVIGVPMPIQRLCAGITTAAAQLSTSAAASSAAAEAILTTDTHTKEIAVELAVDGTVVRVGGMVKGSGMIHPNMATMLAFVTTDARIERSAWQEMLTASVGKSYNMISVDRDTSTNDTCLALANGMAGNKEILRGTESARRLQEALDFVNTSLAKAIVRDGEGATKFLEVQVTGASSEETARSFARGVVTSNLVKAAFFGEDANWGRIVAAMGQAGPLDWTKVTIDIESSAGRLSLMRMGEPVLFAEPFAKEVLAESEQVVRISVGAGQGTAIAWGCDLSYDYVRINGDYRT